MDDATKQDLIEKVDAAKAAAEVALAEVGLDQDGIDKLELLVKVATLVQQKFGDAG